jgi:hypothetical protein
MGRLRLKTTFYEGDILDFEAKYAIKYHNYATVDLSRHAGVTGLSVDHSCVRCKLAHNLVLRS